MATAAPYVVHLPLRDPQGDQKTHVLVGITPTSSSAEGSPTRSLNLELVATDNIEAYVMTLQQGKIAKYKHDDSACSDPEWQHSLEALLLDGHPIEDVEAYAQTSDEGYLFIHVQKKRVSGRPETLGALKLRRSRAAAETLDMFDWCTESVRVRARLEQEIARLERSHNHLQELVARETAHFEELERSKHAFEAQHDSWLRDLLNEKKLKIRMQDKVLATADVDQGKLDAVAATATASSKRRGAAGASRRGKRKAKEEDEEEEEDPGVDVQSDDAASKMDVDDVNQEADERSSHADEEMSDVGMTTPEGSDTASGSDPEPTPAPEPQPKKAGWKVARASPSSSSTARGSGKEKKGKKSANDKPSRNLRNRKTTDSASESEADTKSPATKLNRSPPVFDPDESTASE